MRIKQAKIAQGIRGETSNILTDAKYNLVFEGNMLHVTPKIKSNYGPFIIFPANIAYLEPYTENTSIRDNLSQAEDAPKTTKKK
jgi:hypothetical protein